MTKGRKYYFFEHHPSTYDSFKKTAKDTHDSKNRIINAARECKNDRVKKLDIGVTCNLFCS